MALLAWLRRLVVSMGIGVTRRLNATAANHHSCEP